MPLRQACRRVLIRGFVYDPCAVVCRFWISRNVLSHHLPPGHPTSSNPPVRGLAGISVHDLWPETMKNGFARIDVRMSGDDTQDSELAIFLPKLVNPPQQTESIGYALSIWAFDLGWFNMQTATRVRDNLIETGWLDVTEEGSSRLYC